MRLTIKIMTIFAMMTSLIACGGGEKPADNKSAAAPKTAAQGDEKAARLKNGKKLYLTHCSACHMPKGDGIPGLNPPLIETDWVTGDKDRIIGIVLNGLHEEIEVNGQKYSGPMAALPYLKDNEVADILTYVRERFGKGASAVSPEEVAKVRG